jgi:hypothetical protein
MPLGVVGDMDKQATHGGGQTSASNKSRIFKIRRRQRAHSRSYG